MERLFIFRLALAPTDLTPNAAQIESAYAEIAVRESDMARAESIAIDRASALHWKVTTVELRFAPDVEVLPELPPHTLASCRRAWFEGTHAIVWVTKHPDGGEPTTEIQSVFPAEQKSRRKDH